MVGSVVVKSVNEPKTAWSERNSSVWVMVSDNS